MSDDWADRISEIWWDDILDHGLPAKIIGFGWFGYEEECLYWNVDEAGKMYSEGHQLQSQYLHLARRGLHRN